MNDKLTVKEVAQQTNRTITTVRRWITDGWLTCSKDPLNGRVYIDRKELEDLVTHGPPHRRQDAQ